MNWIKLTKNISNMREIIKSISIALAIVSAITGYMALFIYGLKTGNLYLVIGLFILLAFTIIFRLVYTYRRDVLDKY